MEIFIRIFFFFPFLLERKNSPLLEHLTMQDWNGFIPSFSSLWYCGLLMAWIGSCSFPSPTPCVLSVEIVLSLGTISSPGSQLMQAEVAKGGAGMSWMPKRSSQVQADFALLQANLSMWGCWTAELIAALVTTLSGSAQCTWVISMRETPKVWHMRLASGKVSNKWMVSNKCLNQKSSFMP